MRLFPLLVNHILGFSLKHQSHTLHFSCTGAKSNLKDYTNVDWVPTLHLGYSETNSLEVGDYFNNLVNTLTILIRLFLNQSHENEEYQLHTNVDYETSSDFLDQSYTHEQYRISSDFLNQSHSTNVDYNENNGLINDQSVFETGCQIMDYSDDYMVILRNYNNFNFKNKLNVVLNII